MHQAHFLVYHVFFALLCFFVRLSQGKLQGPAPAEMILGLYTPLVLPLIFGKYQQQFGTFFPVEAHNGIVFFSTWWSRQPLPV